MNTSPFIHALFAQQQQAFKNFPDKVLAIEFVETFFNFLFIPQQHKKQTEVELSNQFQLFQSHLSTLIYNTNNDSVSTQQHTQLFFEAVPSIYEALLQDANAVLQFDPAANSIEEVMVAYPGFFAIAVHRFSHQLYQLGVHILPRVFAEYAHSKTGIDIHPGASIGSSFFIDHGTGIVIGQTTVIGKNVKIYQGVTLGAVSVHKDLATVKRHPTIEDNVVIYSGATILGGDTVIGENSIIGGNVWLTNSVLPNSIVYHNSDVVVRDKQPLPDLINFVI